MKIFIFFLFIILELLCCTKSKPKSCNLVLNDTTNINYGKLYCNDKNKISIKLDSVLNDSRCPAEAECVWAGMATVRFVFTTENQQNIFSLSIGSGPIKSDTIINGYKIKLIALNPYPEINKVIKESDYTAEIIIQK